MLRLTITSCSIYHHLRIHTRGLSMVELMVSLAVSLIIVLAGMTIHIQTMNTQRAVDQTSSAHESANMALHILGRELMNSGFYPTVRTELGATQNIQSYWNPHNLVLNPTSPHPYDFGIFGCNGATFNVSTSSCGSSTTGASDALIVSYFVNDAFGTTIGHRSDCSGNDVALAAINATRIGTSNSTPPLAPLFVANHYQLINSTSTVNGVTQNTKTLSCNGNGSGGTNFIPLVTGLEDLQITYGVFTDDTLVPQRFYSANEIAALPLLQLVDETSPTSAWGHISQVRVCVISKTLMPSASRADNSSSTKITYTDCAGNVQQQNDNDRYLRKTVVQIFGLRNKQVFTF